MPVKTAVGRKGDLAVVEAGLVALIRDIAAARSDDSHRIGAFEALIATDWGAYLFKEHWSSLAIAPGLLSAERASVLAWGHARFPDLGDEGFQVSMPALLALQNGASVSAEGNPGETLAATDVRRYVAGKRSGLLGEGGNWRTLVEFDPEADVAQQLDTGDDRRTSFMALVSKTLAQLEVGALGGRVAPWDAGPRLTVLQFLHELHQNGWEHASDQRGIRVVQLHKHLHPKREGLERKAGSFDELRSYISRQAQGVINLVEASVSDFGPGLLDGFLASAPGARYKSRDRREVLTALLHEKLSGKPGDPDAGLGISQALQAARAMEAFVSLRTNEFWLVMDGARGEERLTARPGSFPAVVGTHWQILYPDMTPGKPRR
jgi:hypothetical protein